MKRAQRSGVVNNHEAEHEELGEEEARQRKSALKVAA